jgi:hypothetical protein
MRLNFNAKMRRHGGRQQTDFHHEEHEGHEVLKKSNWTVFLRALRGLGGERIFSELKLRKNLAGRDREGKKKFLPQNAVTDG